MKKRIGFVLSCLLISIFSVAQDLAVYEAHGPVKEIEWVKYSGLAPYTGGTHKFDRKGRERDFLKRYCAERDRKGRMSREGMDPTDAYEWSYDKKGRVSQCYILFRGDYEFYGYHVRLFYHKNGDVKMYRIHKGDDVRVELKYADWMIVVTERDGHGNWIKRKLYIEGKPDSECEEIRKIVYYE